MKAIRWLLKLMLVMITIPLILAVWLAKWFVAFLHHCSTWSTSNADRWICDFYGPAGGWQHGDSSGIGGSNASAGVVHIR